MPRPRIDPALVAALPCTYEASIPEDYLDVMGHMNVMWYTHLFSMAIGGVLDALGLDRAFMEAEHSGVFALESHIRYLSEVHAGQRVTIHYRLLGRSGRRVHLMLFMANHHKQDVAATFEGVFSHIDMTTRRSSPFPAPVAEQIDRLLAEHRALDWEPPANGVMHA